MKYIKKDLKNKLQSIGLSDKETDIYLSSLEIGPATVLQLSRASDIKRSTIYGIIERLEKKGLMTIQMQGFKQLYEALPPKNLEQLLERQRQELVSCLPELEALYGQHEANSLIRVYRGREAMYSAYSWVLDTLKPSDDYLVFGDLQAWYETDPEYFEQWPIKRREIMRAGRSIFTNSDLSQEYLSKQTSLQTMVKILPTDRHFDAIKIISTHFLLIHKTGQPNLVFVIENPSIIQMYKEMFELMWDLLGEA